MVCTQPWNTDPNPSLQGTSRSSSLNSKNSTLNPRRHLALLFPGTSVIVKYSLNQQEDPKPEVSIRTPYAITCGAIDNDTGLVCTGMRNGGSIVWDNVFNTSKFALEKHAGGAAASVTCCRFVEYPRSEGSAKVYTGAADGTVHEYELEGGTLLRVLCQLRAPVSSLIVTAIPLVIAIDSKNEMRVVVIESGNCAGTLKIPSPGSYCYRLQK
jgi:hypothetical protein